MDTTGNTLAARGFAFVRRYQSLEAAEAGRKLIDPKHSTVIFSPQYEGEHYELWVKSTPTECSICRTVHGPEVRHECE